MLRISQPSGLALLEDGDWMIRLGRTGGSERPDGGCRQILIQDMIFEGNHRKCHLGLIWAQSLSQSKLDRVTVRNVRGPGLFITHISQMTL